ncbi:unnamed protein product [Caenorhabditis brenneri]
MRHLHLVIIGIALAFHVDGSDIFRKKLSCYILMANFVTEIKDLDVEDKTEMKRFKYSCDPIDNCLKNVGNYRGFDEDETKKEITMIQTYCGALNYLTNEFAECEVAISEANSTCYHDWDPFFSKEELRDWKKNGGALRGILREKSMYEEGNR